MTGEATLRMSRRRDEHGSALVELTWIAILMLVPLVYVVITFITVQRSAYGATEAARAAARAYVLSPDLATAEARAFAAAGLAMNDQGVSIAPSDVHITCLPTPASCLQPGSSVEVDIDLHVALPLVPTITGHQPATVAVDASQREAFGTYRQAVP